VVVSLLAAVSCLGGPAFAGPPFLTDDPEPVDYKHFSLLFAVGHTIAGEDHLISYVGLYWTW
jgi:hypothetical protein